MRPDIAKFMQEGMSKEIASRHAGEKSPPLESTTTPFSTGNCIECGRKARLTSTAKCVHCHAPSQRVQRGIK